ncbi:nuclear transport factor 2 family protein [Microbacterium koreense]|uniref:Nuclear transport factor 2 family protein n=1 Tax=Microbacterium koreense TaxID=323761 RepID=A0ABW2ZNB5_9MICO
MTRWAWDPALAEVLARRFRGWTDCNCTADMESLAGFLHPDFLYVSVFGKRYDKESYIALASSLTDGAFYEIHRTSARRRGDVAELDGEYFTHSVTEDGDDLTAHTRFTGTWVQEGDEWVCLTHHGTLYEPDPDYAAAVAARIALRRGGRSL